MPQPEITSRKRTAAAEGSLETVLWTCLPNGTAGTGQPLNLSVLVSPRLTNGGTGTLADYPHFLDWPQTLRDIGAYDVVLFTRIPHPQQYFLPATPTPPADDPQATPDSELWTALFPPDTPVRSYAADDYSGRFVLSYPAANIYNTVKAFYQKVGTLSPGDFPANGDLLDTYGLNDIVVTKSFQGGYLNNNQAPVPLSLPTGEAFETFLAGLKPKPAPTGLTATAAGSSAVDLSWNAAAGATGYNLARYNPSQGDYEYLNQSGPLTATTYTDSNVAPETTYSYEVMAIYPDGDSGYSSPVSVTTGQTIIRAVPRAASGEPRTFPDTAPAEVPLNLLPSYSSFQPTQAQWDTLRLQVFHHPRSQTSGEDGTPGAATQLGPLPDPSDFQNTLDFHQRVALLAKYPALMRRLGLILDLTLAAEALPPESTISLSPPLPAPVVSITPQTALAPGSAFQALSGDPTLRNGQLDLGPDSPHSLVEVDIDGAAFKLFRLANTLLVSRYRPSVDTPATTSVAALRSGGLSLVRGGRAAWLSTKFSTAAQQNADAETNSTILYAEDLVRGYRVDISDSVDATWRSLVQRIGRYVVAGVPYGTHQDEAIVQLAATQPPNAPGGTTDLYLHESLLRWDGWSLAAPRPFLTIGETGVEAPGTVPGLNLMVGFQPVPGSLPRLRFGRAYQVRARTVDLAGNSLSLTQVNAPLATDPKTYARYEPVPAPEVVLREAPGLAESLTRLVIRSANADPTLDHVRTSAISERHIAPPQAGEDIAEAHGMFDGPGGVRQDSYAVIVAGEGAFSQVSVPNATGTPSLYPLDSDAQATVPYLPDPLCAGAALRFLPGVPGSRVTAIPFGTNWPALPPFRVVLQEGPFASVFNAGTRVLTVSMPKGQTVTVRMSSYLPPNAPGNALGSTPTAALEVMGIWRWIEEAGGVSSSQLATLRALAAQGRHWMLTPYRDLQLVHAVQQPLVTPTLSGLVPTKSLGSTYATFTGLLSCDGNTTAVLDMLAQWQEPFDDPTGALPTMGVINGKAHAFQIPLRFPLDALGRFPIGNPLPVLGQNGETVAEYDTVHEALTLVGDPARHEFGDTKYRRVAYTPVGTSRFKEFFALSDNAGAVDDYDNPYTRRQASPTVVDILNSARPAAPKVLYVLPAFRFTPSADGTQSTRRGGLRVYLDRPWWSSGDGELLGVVLWNATYTRHITGIGPRREINLPDKFAPYVTQWGADPLWVADAPTTLPDVTDFTNEADTSGAAATAGFNQFGLTLEELPGETVGVAPYAVGFDSDRNLWYSDIDINPQSYYFPFIRLALARCQPYSVPNAHLSRVVLAQFAQLTPDRSVSLVQDGRTLSITLVGVAPGESLGRQNIVRVGFESRPQADGGDDLGWTPLPINGNDTTEALQDQVGNPSLQGYTTGVVPLPGADAGSAFRLVVREYEELDSTRAALPGAAYGRLIYADALDVTTFVNG